MTAGGPSRGKPEPARLSLAELRVRYVERARPLPAAMEALLALDPRPGARALLEHSRGDGHVISPEDIRLFETGL